MTGNHTLYLIYPPEIQKPRGLFSTLNTSEKMENNIKAKQRVRVRNKRTFITSIVLVPLSKSATKTDSPGQT